MSSVTTFCTSTFYSLPDSTLFTIQHQSSSGSDTKGISSFRTKDWCYFLSTHFPCNVTGNSRTNSSPGTANAKPFQTARSFLELSAKIPAHTGNWVDIIHIYSVQIDIQSDPWLRAELFCFIHWSLNNCHKRSVYFSGKQKEISFNFSSWIQSKQPWVHPRGWARHQHTGRVGDGESCRHESDQNNGGMTEKYKRGLL